MGKKLGLILGLVVLGCVGGYFFLQQAGQSRYADYLPADALGTVNLTDLNTVTDSFTSTALGRVLAKDSVHAIMADAQATPESVVRYDQLYDSVAQTMTNPAFRTIFGEEATVALLPPDAVAFQQNPAEALKNAVVILAQSSASGALDLLTRVVPGKTITRVQVGELALTKLLLDQGEVLYGYVDGKTVLVAYNPTAIQTCLAQRKAEHSLADQPFFTQALEYWQTFPQEQVRAKICLNLPAITKELSLAQEARNADLLEMITGMQSGTGIIYQTNQGLEGRGHLAYAYDQLLPAMQQQVDAATTGNQTLGLFHSQALAYSWQTAAKPPALLEKLIIGEQTDVRLADLIQQNLGVSAGELGRAIGPQYGMVLEDIVRTGLFPVPKLTLFLQIRERQVAQRAVDSLRQLVGQQGLSTEEQEQQGGQVIYSWPFLPGDSARPALTLTDSMLYLANGRPPLRALLTTPPSRALQASVATRLGPELSKRITEANSACFVLYPRLFAQRSGDLLKWIGQLSFSENRLSVATFNEQLRQLMLSTEVMVMTTRLQKEGSDWALSLRKDQPPPPSPEQ